MALYRLPITILTLSLVYIFIAPDEPFSMKLFLKLLPMIAIVLYAFRIVPKERKVGHLLLIFGLIISCFGDATIHLGVIGLTSYFLAHVCYAFAFFSIAKLTKFRTLLCIPILLYVGLFGISLTTLLQKNSDDALIFPVVAYILIISITLSAAIFSGNKHAILGTLLFVISHSILVWDMFIEPVAFAKAIVMLSYYAAQFFIAVSIYSLVESKRRIIW